MDRKGFLWPVEKELRPDVDVARHDFVEFDQGFQEYQCYIVILHDAGTSQTRDLPKAARTFIFNSKLVCGHHREKNQRHVSSAIV